MIRLGGCPGWSESSLGAQLLVLSWGGSYNFDRIPKGISLCTLRREDAETLRSDWEGSSFREDLEGYFKIVIENCLRDADEELLAYVCMQYNGSMAMLYVKPDHDKNYSKIVLTDLTRKLLRKGEVAYGFVPVNNAALINMMREMEFVWVPRWDMVWVHFEPKGEGPYAAESVHPGLHCDNGGQNDNLTSCFCCADNRNAGENLVFVNGMSLATGWMDGWIGVLRPFQQYFSHIRTMEGWTWKALCNEAPFRFGKNLASL